MALWCSRLARQPVTLEVDGSSPFGVAKTLLSKDKGVFLFIFQFIAGREHAPALRNSIYDNLQSKYNIPEFVRR